MSKIIFVLSAAFALLSHQVPVHARLLKRAQPGADPERVRKFDNFANVYNFTWARNADMAAAVKEVYVSGEWNEHFDSKTKLFFPQRLAGEEHAKRIRDNLNSRVPIYFGGGLYYGDVNFDNYVQTLDELNNADLHAQYGAEVGWAIAQGNKNRLLESMAQRLDHEYYAHHVDQPVRFGVCGPVRRIEENNQGRKLMYVSHIWGINLESDITADYMRFTQGTGTITKRDEYAATFREILTFAFEGAAHAARTENKLASLRIPKVSLGQFLRAVRDQDSVRFAHEAFYKAVFELAGLYRDRGVTVVLCIYGGASGMDEEILATYPSNGYESNVKVESNLFELSTTSASDPAMPADDIVTVQINAWDSHSYMGNRQVNDNSIDGYMVAGWGAAGTSNANTSFLQNPIFSSYAHAGPDTEFWQMVPSPESSSAVPVAEEVPEETGHQEEVDVSTGAATGVSRPAHDEEDEESSNSSSSSISTSSEESNTSSSGDDDDEGPPSQAQAATNDSTTGTSSNVGSGKPAPHPVSATSTSTTKSDTKEQQEPEQQEPEQQEPEEEHANGFFCGC